MWPGSGPFSATAWTCGSRRDAFVPESGRKCRRYLSGGVRQLTFLWVDGVGEAERSPSISTIEGVRAGLAAQAVQARVVLSFAKPISVRCCGQPSGRCPDILGSAGSIGERLLQEAGELLPAHLALVADQNRVGEAKAGDAVGDLAYLLLRMLAGVAGVGLQSRHRPHLDLWCRHNIHSVAPSSSRATRSARSRCRTMDADVWRNQRSRRR